MIAAHDVPQPIMRIPALISSLRQNSGTIGWLHGGCSDISLLIGGRLVRFGRVEEQCEHEYAPKFEVATDGTVLSVETTSGNTVYADVSVASPTAGRVYSTRSRATPAPTTANTSRERRQPATRSRSPSSGCT